MTMTTTIDLAVLEIDLADRMHKALRVSGIPVAEIAEQMGVNRNTVGTWLSGRIEPSRARVRQFAQLTGVPVEWLEIGDEWSRLSESNRRPSHYKADFPAYRSVADEDDLCPCEVDHEPYEQCPCNCHGVDDVDGAIAPDDLSTFDLVLAA